MKDLFEGVEQTFAGLAGRAVGGQFLCAQMKEIRRYCSFDCHRSITGRRAEIHGRRGGR